MALPLLEYKPTTQNQRVTSFGKSDQNEDTPYVYRIEDANSPSELQALVREAYRQVFNEQLLLKFNRQVTLETRLANGSITVRDFIRELVKSERFYTLVVSVNDNYRLVEICVKRLLGRAPYNQAEKIAWSIKIGTLGFHGFVDALIDSDEYTQAFGDSIVPYQRKRMEQRPFTFLPRYGEDYRETAGTAKTDWRITLEKFYTRKYQDRQLAEGDPRRFRDVAAAIAPKGNYAQRTSAFDIDFLNKVPVRGRR
ncbi:phycobilisome rod-core linker polypeptide [Oculatella sp. LEGE 06141]|uniref:phycobilisome rod-core linker polypeptide n=1 Tax=Oculatella sp. LEGE 06141 TaxID=1828648 RepID=UPI001882710A|nr:phycobilisome rod-core linker polypeptide [Oculatella sp. LEGE 06141]MBE9182134.1 phycobilisome rod-core linker polypeptide [Oculatella sp. LEGE 06141]